MKLRHALLLAALLLLPSTSFAADRATAPAKAANLVGTWVLDVSFDPELNIPPFRAIQTFHAGGTMTETSDLLASLAEGPGAGAWRGQGSDYETTFQLFIFDENQAPAGVIEVRERIHLDTNRTLSGRAEAFLFLPGEPEAIPLGGGPIVGSRVRVTSLAD